MPDIQNFVSSICVDEIIDDLKPITFGEIAFEYCSINLGEKAQIKIEGWFNEIQLSALNKFECTLIQIPHFGANQYCEVRKTRNRYLGYIFPIATLSEISVIKEAGNSWVKRYAAAASLSIVNGIIESDRIISHSLDDLAKSVFLRDLFPENSGILVLGKEELVEDGLSIEEVQLYLNQKYYLTYPGLIHSEASQNNLIFEKRIRVGPISKTFSSNAPTALHLLSMAVFDKNIFAKFLSYYQILEIAIAAIFEKEIENLVLEAQNSQISAWDLSEKLQKISKNKKRLKLIREYLRNGAHHIHLDNLKAACNKLSFVQETSQNEEDEDWATQLYKVRNQIVHNQHKIEIGDTNKLSDVCEYFHLACVEIILYLDLCSDEVTVKS